MQPFKQPKHLCHYKSRRLWELKIPVIIHILGIHVLKKRGQAKGQWSLTRCLKRNWPWSLWWVAVDQDMRFQQERDSVPTKWGWQLLHQETLAFTKRRRVLKNINNAQTQEGQVSRLIYWDEFSVANDFLTTVKLPSLGFWSKSWHRDKFLAKKWHSMG